MATKEVYEDMWDALEDAYQHGRIERDTYMHLLDLIDEVEQDYDALEERMRVDRYTHAHVGGENYDLRAENVRLRSLVSRMYWTIHGIAETYPTVLDPSLHTRLSEPFQQRIDEVYADEMRDLGIEA